MTAPPAAAVAAGRDEATGDGGLGAVQQVVGVPPDAEHHVVGQLVRVGVAAELHADVDVADHGAADGVLVGLRAVQPHLATGGRVIRAPLGILHS